MDNPFEVFDKKLSNIETLLVLALDEIQERRKEQSEKLLSPKEVCRIFRPKISLPTLARWSKNNSIPFRKIGGRMWYKKSDIFSNFQSLDNLPDSFND